ncbi:MAG: thiamine pyrophosphate-requiring protein [Pseudomonadota bacterium]|nr:thiamine pyrophosphate-requiring protein [Pseudomonadota bacterium]
MKGVDAIAAILKREGVEFLVCYPRQPLIEAAAKAGIRPILCRQERMGVAIADGFSRTTNGKRIGVFSMQQGPGTENSFPGAAQAYSDNVPLLMIPGGEALAKHFVEPNFQAMDNFAHVTKWCAQINKPDRVTELFRRAFYQLRSGKPGPVLLEVPREIWDADVDVSDYTPVTGNRAAPDPADVAVAAKLLLDAKRLVIQAGSGVMYAEATDALLRLAELLDAPVMTTLPGKSAFPEDHPLALGASAISTTGQIAQFLKETDVIFGVGTSLTRTNYGRTLPDEPTMIHSTIDPSDVNKDYRADAVMIGDAKLTLEALIGEIETSGAPRPRGTVDELATAKKVWLDEWMGELTSDEIPINPYRVIWDLLGAVDTDNTIITHDAGSPRDQIVPFWVSTKPRTYLGWGKSTQLGAGLGLIMGAKLAEPDKLCINIMGDAAIGMTGLDIETAVRNKIAILTIVFNNGVMAIETDSMHYAIETYEAHSQGGNYSEIAKSLGAWSIRVDSPDAFLPALKDAIAATETGQPALIECITKEGYDFSKYP